VAIPSNKNVMSSPPPFIRGKNTLEHKWIHWNDYNKPLPITRNENKNKNSAKVYYG
jgi:hypothetical protein